MYQLLHKNYRYLILIAVVGIGGYYANSNRLSSSSKIITDDPATITSSNIEHEVAPIPKNFEVLSTIDKEITNALIPDKQNLLVAQPHHYDEPLIPAMSGGNSPLIINSNINLLTGSDLWVYRPHLKEEVELEQQLSLDNDATVMQMDDALLNKLVLGDSLILSLPNKGTQQIVIASIKRDKNDVIIWGLQNSQRQDIGKITQIREIKEGSFITDDKQEYHLRTVKNKGWIASKDQLINNNNQAITDNKQPFSEQFLNVK